MTRMLHVVVAVLLAATFFGFSGPAPVAAETSPEAGVRLLAQLDQQRGRTELAPRAAERRVPGKAVLSLSQSQMQSAQRMRGGRLDFSCNPVVCICRGDPDCNDMFGTNVCGDRAICIGDYCYCERSRAMR